jgi:hypothetical protein
MTTHSGEVWVRADSKDDAVDTVEKELASQGLDLIDHRTYDVTNPDGQSGGYADDNSHPWLGSGKSSYRMSITTRTGGNSQRELGLRP